MQNQRYTGDVLNQGEGILSKNCILDSRLDAELLLAHLLKVDRQNFLIKKDIPVSESVFTSYMEMIQGRVNHRPLAYLLGEQEFMGLNFHLDEAVLIPRPETELLVEEALRRIKDYNDTGSGGGSLKIIDLGTGSGNIAISLAKGLRTDGIDNFQVFASDVDMKALDTAKRNAGRNQVSDNMKFLCGDLFEPFRSKLFSGNVDFIVSNPPYIASGDFPALQKEVLEEPVGALYAGDDGLMFHRRIIGEAGKFLVAGGFVILEMGEGQGEEVKKLIISENELSFVKTIRDYSRRDRIVVAQRISSR